MCGFPERLMIQSVGSEYVVVAFGINDAMTPFATHLAEAYPNAQTLADEPIA
jgi:formate hydrogenlyase subunit 3/multisubunit Na+/H+ antiporter MnhD subunit